MKRVAALSTASLMLALPAAAPAFHHGGLPATSCHAPAAVSPSDENGRAKEALTTKAGLSLPLAPVGTPGNGQGGGAAHCALSHEH